MSADLKRNMEHISQIVIDIILLFAVAAAVDKCLGGRWGLSQKMDEGLAAMSEMCISMVGMLLLAPMIGSMLGPVVAPFYHALGADPAMFATSILACDMGGYQLAYALADSPEAAQFSGCILGTALGGILTFTIPLGFSLLKPEKQPYFAVGILAGIATVPAGTIAGGLAAGYGLSMVLHNTLPILLLSALIVLGLCLIQKVMIRLFILLGKAIMILATAGFMVGVIQELTSLTIIPGMGSVLDGIRVVGSVGIVLCGAYPMIAVVTKLCGRQLEKLAGLIHVDRVAVACMVASTANIMPFLGSLNEMSPAGLVIGTAFVAASNAAFGDHLGYIGGLDMAMIVPMLISKAVNAAAGLLLAEIICNKSHYPAEEGGTHETC